MSAPPRPDEFALIGSLFAPLAAGAPGALGLLDDAALIDPEPGRQIVTTLDMMVEGVHFLGGDPADQVAQKLLRVNLSDLASMGARPTAYLLGLAISDAVAFEWLSDFARGLADDQARFSIVLTGGDTTATTGPTCLSITAIGDVEPGAALLRSGARPGDDVYVSGTIGDAVLGLRVLRGEHLGLETPSREAAVAAYRLPWPRLALGMALTGVASAAADVSDGLLSDIGHICAASGVGAVIEAGRVPHSPAATAAMAAKTASDVDLLGGGDDYELVFTAHADQAARVEEAAQNAATPVTRIGTITAEAAVTLIDANGMPVPVTRTGYRHF